MKLANALSQRAELQTRIHQLETRLYNNAQVQEGESPAEDPQDLLQELEEDYARLEALIACINRTNCCTLVDGVPLSDLLARRDCRKGKLGVLRNFLDNASELVSRRTVGEIKRAGVPPHGGRDQNSQHCGCALHAERGGPDVQGAAGAG